MKLITKKLLSTGINNLRFLVTGDFSIQFVLTPLEEYYNSY